MDSGQQASKPPEEPGQTARWGAGVNLRAIILPTAADRTKYPFVRNCFQKIRCKNSYLFLLKIRKFLYNKDYLEEQN